MKPLELKSCLIGMLLGDACITSSYPRVIINHGIAQKDYALWKSKILENYTTVNVREYQNYGFGKYYPRIRVETKSIPEFKILREQMYFDGHKTITSHLLKILDWRGIAIWFLDDGHITKNGAFFATHGFTEAENHLIRHWLKKLHGLKSNVYKDRKWYTLRVCAEDTDKIVRWVKALDIPSMNYKVDSYEKLPEDSGRNKDGTFVHGFNGMMR